jgi:hypothetical protein
MHESILEIEIYDAGPYAIYQSRLPLSNHLPLETIHIIIYTHNQFTMKTVDNKYKTSQLVKLANIATDNFRYLDILILIA